MITFDKIDNVWVQAMAITHTFVIYGNGQTLNTLNRYKIRNNDHILMHAQLLQSVTTHFSKGFIGISNLVVAWHSSCLIHSYDRSCLPLRTTQR